MATVPKSGPNPPRMPIVVPEMTAPPHDLKMSTENMNEPTVVATDSDAWDTEMQLVSSLAKLQRLEGMIHQLRTLLPGRLLEPLKSTVNPGMATGQVGVSSPRALFEQLKQCVQSGVSEVADFQTLWRSSEMKAVWDRVDTQIQNNGGQLLQPRGVWEEDYDVLLEGLVKEEQAKQAERRSAEEESERSKIQATEGGWRAIAEGFAQRNVPGVRVQVSNMNTASVLVALVKAGMILNVHTVEGLESHGIPDWRITSKASPGQPVSKLEGAVLQCLNSRPRQWDLLYLLDMISSYANIKQTPCMKCNKMTDNAAQLPAVRKPKTVPSVDGQSTTVWEAYHPSCVE
ncbi:RNA polymerase II mediator complex subunit MED27 domain-containing protein [Aspergillus saccharolyticus JOP 1030-1]|uniref:Mediator complex subunit 27 n=1 Tax=Aspergillus saccharolyticus JOP 1030-1 TaxID=1450539 RepID=A0A318ZL89_9EURO|nr:hypothetical protein BP01DRAFT_292390 [Aspergillus saccharolyticus JOP 1030-1]PYH47184.1 hypothetical protein BP01DRAFT_292390 [Aspergillus saccharolyticus JOP 1030-1]